MPSTPRVGIACRRATERVIIADALRLAGCEPVLLLDACLAATGLIGQPPVLVVADVGLLTPHFILAMRKGDPNRPILAIGDGDEPDEKALARKGISFHVRPLTEAALLLAVSLAQAESRNLRRSERTTVPRLATTIEGAPAVLLDVSSQGLRLELDSSRGSKLSPQFVVQVSLLKMSIPVQRVWVRAAPDGGASKVQCGATLLASDERTLMAWQRLADPSVGRLAAARPVPAKVPVSGLFGRLTSAISGAALPWRRSS